MNQPDKVLYTAKAHTRGGWDGGASRSSDGRLDINLSVPGKPGTRSNAGWARGKEIRAALAEPLFGRRPIH